MRKLILMTSAAIIAPLSGLAEDITCTATPNCADLGYTESSCPENKGVKCPWGEAWFCPPSPPEVCEIGSILYSDMTCYKEAQAGKTPIGVVVYVDGLGTGQAMALKSLDTKYKWATKAMDILGLTNYSLAEAASQDVSSCENSKIIMAAGDKDTYPAVWAAHEYSTEETSAGDWCLPAAGIFTSYYNNQDVINTGFSRAGGTQISTTTGFTSSSDSSLYGYWISNFNANYGLSVYHKEKYHSIRPVFEFVQTFEGVCKGAFKYNTCKGENETGGVGEACGGRYSECSCAENYRWNGTECEYNPWGKCTGIAANCAIGDILFSDGSCSTDVVDGKTAIAVVVYKSDDGKCGQALALESINNDRAYNFGKSGTDIPDLPNYDTSLTASQDFASCENTKIILAHDYLGHDVTRYVHEYTTTGTAVGDWCLPAAGVLNSLSNNIDIINAGYTKAGESAITKDLTSSTEKDAKYGWIYSPLSGIKAAYKHDGRPLRAVLEF